MFVCGGCPIEFRTQDDCEKHMRDNDHWWECDWCERTFHTECGCEAHMDALQNHGFEFQCETCDREFGSEQAVTQHMNALSHWRPPPGHRCDTCDKTFYSKKTAEQHMDYWEHWALRYECETCDRTFRSQQGANQHMDHWNHWALAVKCETCDRYFYTGEAAEQHTRAKLHHKARPKENVPTTQPEKVPIQQAKLEQHHTSHYGAASHPRKEMATIQGDNDIIPTFNAKLEKGNTMIQTTNAMFKKTNAMIKETTAMIQQLRVKPRHDADYKDSEKASDLQKLPSVQVKAKPKEEIQYAGIKQASYFKDSPVKQLQAELHQTTQQKGNKQVPAPQKISSQANEKRSKQDHDDKDSQQSSFREKSLQSECEAMCSPLDTEDGISCPFCKDQLRTASALTHHIDIGACPRAPDFAREVVCRIFHRLNPNGVVQTEPSESPNGTFV